MTEQFAKYVTVILINEDIFDVPDEADWDACPLNP